MDQEPDNSQNQERRRSLTDLLIWLALVPFILGTLLCCGQLALLLLPGNPTVKTGSLLSAEYGRWPYESIAAIDIERFIRDIEKEQRLYGTSIPEDVLDETVFWVPPTPVVEIALVTPGTGTLRVNTPTQALRTPTRTASPTSRIVTVTRSATSTALPTVTPTRTFTLPPPLPTWTHTPEPEEEDPPTRTPTVTVTATVTASATSTNTPTATIAPTLTFTLTPEIPPTSTPTITPTYAPVRPFAENNGIAEPAPGQGCRAFFGYRNDNPQAVDIPVSVERNWIDDPVAQDNPPQPTHFEVGRIFSVFEFTWFTGQNLTWWLDGRSAVAIWCITPTPTPTP